MQGIQKKHFLFYLFFVILKGKKGRLKMSDAKLLSEVIRPDEHFYWTVTGSIRDLKYQPLTWLIVIALAVGFIPMARHGLLDTWGWLVVAAVSLIPLLFCKRIFNSYTLTDKRLIIISGIVTKHVDEIELFRVVDSTVRQSMIDTWVNLGTVRVTSEDMTGTIRMEKVPNPNRLRENLREAYMAARNAKGTLIMENVNTPSYR